VSPIIGYIQDGSKSLQAGVQKWLDNKKHVDCTVCKDMRRLSKREFLSHDEIIYVDISNTPWPTPLSIKFNKLDYQLRMITYGNGGHFCASILINNKWYAYDGLKEYHVPVTGLKRLLKPIAPAGYLKDYALFCKCI
jgi:hypothetical protein